VRSKRSLLADSSDSTAKPVCATVAVVAVAVPGAIVVGRTVPGASLSATAPVLSVAVRLLKRLRASMLVPCCCADDVLLLLLTAAACAGAELATAAVEVPLLAQLLML
jgi:hypothetical protein